MDFFNEDIIQSTGEQPYDDEEAEATEEDVNLAILGIQPYYASIYKRHNPTKAVLNSKTNLPTGPFFKYYLENCDADMLKAIKHKHLSPALFKMYENAEPVKKLGVADDDMSPEAEIERYIERNAELIQQVSNLGKFKQYTIFLWNLMSNKMDFSEEVNDIEIQMIEEIKEGIK